ncbi:hypothetical protein TRFO_31234 [Tritrichomonas foetus]|uniref:Uncharacterized protein n=1 Tax=Tritrichomonas foetus TaxID=1144522 RepID=A0A1J4JX82_9EUKA|nr:hypothetical protein TRFO_31234 [Tritrichomonas foetus]|eukprot:OHT01885.1 hypothetical protein TRFO_31234 [Tritrichomonas foetus]
MGKFLKKKSQKSKETPSPTPQATESIHEFEEEEETAEKSVSTKPAEKSESTKSTSRQQELPSPKEKQITPDDESYEEEDESDPDRVLSVDLGEGAMENDDNCPLRFSIVQHRVDDFKFHIQKQKNELFYINKNVNDLKKLLDDLYNENQTLSSIVDEFKAEALNNSAKFADNKKLYVSPETDIYCQKVESLFADFVKVQAQLSDDAFNVSQLVENLKMLKEMNSSLKEQIKRNPENEADEIIDLLEDDIVKLEEENEEMKKRYLEIIQGKQDQIDELQMKLESKPALLPKQLVKRNTKNSSEKTKSIKKKSPRGASPRKASPRKASPRRASPRRSSPTKENVGRGKTKRSASKAKKVSS